VHGWAECGRTQAPGNLQHWWTFSNAVAGGPQSSGCNYDIHSEYSTAPHLVERDRPYMYLGYSLSVMEMTTMVIIMMALVVMTM
jgi:hypothetical protein